MKNTVDKLSPAQPSPFGPPVAVFVRGIPGSGKSHLAKALQQAMAPDSVVILDPDATNYDSDEYRKHVAELTRNSVDPKLHAYRFLRQQAYDALEQGKSIIWNQAFRDLDIFRQMAARLRAHSIRHGQLLSVLIVEVDIDPTVALERIRQRMAAGGHGMSEGTLQSYVASFGSFASYGYTTVRVHGEDDTTRSVAAILETIHHLQQEATQRLAPSQYMVRIQRELNALLSIAEDASEAIMTIRRSADLATEYKRDGSPVTRADRAAHRLITAGLRRVFPDVPVLSEEGEMGQKRDAVQQTAFWLVDPLDGTKGFLAGSDEFAVCLAFIENHVARFGIIALPAKGIFYYGGPGLGSFKRVSNQPPVPIHVAVEPTRVVLGGTSVTDDTTNAYLGANYAGYTRTSIGSQLKFAVIAEGLADAFPRLHHSMCLWDVAAADAILTAAGGVLRRLDGDPIDYTNQTLLAGDFVASR